MHLLMFQLSSMCWRFSSRLSYVSFYLHCRPYWSRSSRFAWWRGISLKGGKDQRLAEDRFTFLQISANKPLITHIAPLQINNSWIFATDLIGFAPVWSQVCVQSVTGCMFQSWSNWMGGIIMCGWKKGKEPARRAVSSSNQSSVFHPHSLKNKAAATLG